MAVEALKIIRGGEEEGRKILDEARAQVSTIQADTEEEIKRLKEQAREEEKQLAAEIAARYTAAGRKEEEAILKAARAEAEKLKTATKSNLDRAVDAILAKLLGME
jgi:vacuolar-type H+-ATPase subunit H